MLVFYLRSIAFYSIGNWTILNSHEAHPTLCEARYHSGHGAADSTSRHDLGQASRTQRTDYCRSG